jgi:cytochrome c
MEKSMRGLAAVAFFSGLAVFSSEGRPNTDLEAQGRKIMSEHCSRCHAIDKHDESPHASAPPFRDVVTRYDVENLAESLAEGIVTGHPDMPESKFEPSEISAILAYLSSLEPAKN